MTNLDILLPLFVQVLVTFVLLFSMARARIGAVKRKEARIGDIALGQQNWPARPTQIANSYSNQFELPVLFYVVVVLAIATSQISLPLVVLAWLFVLARIVHAYIHTTSNNISHRFNAFAVSCFVLMAMWLVYAWQILVP